MHEIQPVQIPATRNEWFKYRQVLYNVADGVRANDAACVELAVRFIQLHFIGSYAGFIRSRMARRLKHVSLTPEQRQRLHDHFFDLVVRDERTQEFRHYLALWRQFISDDQRNSIVRLVMGAEGESAANWLMDKLRPKQRFKPTSQLEPLLGPQMRSSIKRSRYVAPNLREAKEFADRCGQEYYKAIWRRPKLMAQCFLIESAAKFTGYDCSEDVNELERQINQAIQNFPVAKDSLRHAREHLSALKNSDPCRLT